MNNPAHRNCINCKHLSADAGLFVCKKRKTMYQCEEKLRTVLQTIQYRTKSKNCCDLKPIPHAAEKVLVKLFNKMSAMDRLNLLDKKSEAFIYEIKGR